MFGFHHIEHAFQPVFNQKLKHCPKKCRICYLETTKNPAHLSSNIPLKYQDTKFSIDVTRFLFTINMTSSSIPERDLVYKLYEEDLSCNMKRIFQFQDLEKAIPPTKEFISSELVLLSEKLKTNSHIFLHVNGGLSADTDGNFFCGDTENLSTLDFSLLLELFPSNVTFWGIFDFPSADKFLTQMFFYKYSYSGEEGRVLCVPGENSNNIQANILFFTIGNGVKDWTVSMVRNRSRMTLHTMLTSIDRCVLYSSRKIKNLQKINFGFG